MLSTQSCLILCNPMDCSPYQAPLSMGLSRQEYWSGLPFPSPGDLPDSGIKPRSPALHADSLLLSHQGSPTHSTAEYNSVPFKFHQKQVLHSKAKNMSFKELLYENPAELFQILKDDAVKMLHSICQQIWKTQQWPQD